MREGHAMTVTYHCPRCAFTYDTPTAVPWVKHYNCHTPGESVRMVPDGLARKRSNIQILDFGGAS